MSNPHLKQAPSEYGCALDSARAVVVLIHGRGQVPQYMEENIVKPLALDDVYYIAPAAAENSWYPMGFMAPFEDNEPWLTQTLDCIDSHVEGLISEGLSSKQIFLIGFSQGACVVGEYLCRKPRPYAGAGMLTGGLIGPEGTDWPGESLQHTPILLATSDIDPWIPLARAELSRDVLTRRGAEVDFRVYDGMDHIINDEEVAALKRMIASD